MTTALDEVAFEQLSLRHRRELHVHCYRMLASFDAAEDAVQETFLRAWRGRDAFGGPSFVRAWLYRIATNVCLDVIRGLARRVPENSTADISWLQPYPDRLLDEVVAQQDDLDAVVIERETIELAFLTALQILPPRQRAALLLRDVLALSAAETAEMLETTVAAANSALQRARAAMQQHLPARRAEWTVPIATATERELLERFIAAHEHCDADAALSIAATDIRVTMPPYPWRFDGVDQIRPLMQRAFGPDREGDWRLVATSANRLPTAASYLRRNGDTEFRAFKFDVLRIVEDKVVEITTFGPELFAVFGLPPILSTAQPDGR